MAKTGKAHQWQNHPVGRPRTTNEEYLERLRELVHHSPRDYGYSFHRWTANWLSQHLAQELGIEIHERHVNRLLKQMGLSTRQNLPSKGSQGSGVGKMPRILIQDLSPVNNSDSSSG